jgi:hypothetical protein
MPFQMPVSNRQRGTGTQALSEGLIRALGIIKQAKDDEETRADRGLARQIQQATLASTGRQAEAEEIRLRGARETERLTTGLNDFETRQAAPGAAGPVTPEEAAAPAPLANRSRGDLFRDTVLAKIRNLNDPAGGWTPERVGQERIDRETARARENENFTLHKDQVGASVAASKASAAHAEAEAGKTRRETELLGKPKPDQIMETNKFARQLKQDFLGNQTTKDFQVIERSAKTMEAALKDFRARDAEARAKGKPLDRSAMDQTLITLFNKLLDPSSVVRESEYARTPDGLAKIEGLRGKLEAIASGGPGITDAFRDELIASAGTLVKAAEQGFRRYVEDSIADAQSYGIEPERVVGGYTRYMNQAPDSPGPADGGGAAVQVATKEEWDALAPGTAYIGPDGKRAVKK